MIDYEFVVLKSGDLCQAAISDRKKNFDVGIKRFIDFGNGGVAFIRFVCREKRLT